MLLRVLKYLSHDPKPNLSSSETIPWNPRITVQRSHLREFSKHRLFRFCLFLEKSLILRKARTDKHVLTNIQQAEFYGLKTGGEMKREVNPLTLETETDQLNASMEVSIDAKSSDDTIPKSATFCLEQKFTLTEVDGKYNPADTFTEPLQKAHLVSVISQWFMKPSNVP